MAVQHPAVVTDEQRVAADAIREIARAMPIYGAKGRSRKFDGDDVVTFLLEYADSLDSPPRTARPPRPRNVA